MYPSEVRQQILTSQQALFAELEALEALAQAPCPVTAEQLQARSAALVPKLIAHMKLDDSILAPALEDTDAWRAFRLSRLQEHHEHQAEGIVQIVRQLTNPTSDEQLCAVILRVAAAVRADFEEEQRLMLSPDVLRDDLVTVAAGA